MSAHNIVRQGKGRDSRSTQTRRYLRRTVSGTEDAEVLFQEERAWDYLASFSHLGFNH
jgi:DNA-directed RNA polymerase subunit F